MPFGAGAPVVGGAVNPAAATAQHIQSTLLTLSGLSFGFDWNLPFSDWGGLIYTPIWWNQVNQEVPLGSPTPLRFEVHVYNASGVRTHELILEGSYAAVLNLLFQRYPNARITNPAEGLLNVVRPVEDQIVQAVPPLTPAQPRQPMSPGGISREQDLRDLREMEEFGVDEFWSRRAAWHEAGRPLSTRPREPLQLPPMTVYPQYPYFSLPEPAPAANAAPPQSLPSLPVPVPTPTSVFTLPAPTPPGLQLPPGIQPRIGSAVTTQTPWKPPALTVQNSDTTHNNNAARVNQIYELERQKYLNNEPLNLSNLADTKQRLNKNTPAALAMIAAIDKMASGVRTTEITRYESIPSSEVRGTERAISTTTGTSGQAPTTQPSQRSQLPALRSWLTAAFAWLRANWGTVLARTLFVQLLAWLLSTWARTDIWEDILEFLSELGEEDAARILSERALEFGSDSFQLSGTQPATGRFQLDGRIPTAGAQLMDRGQYGGLFVDRDCPQPVFRLPISGQMVFDQEDCGCK